MHVRGLTAAAAACALAAVASARVVGRETHGEGLGDAESPGVAARQAQLGPCSLVGQAQRRGAEYLPPSMAAACLNSVELDVRRATGLID